MLGCCLQHMVFFFCPDTGYPSVVFYPDQEFSSFRIGKGNQASGNFPCIVDLKLEILLLVFPPGYQILDMPAQWFKNKCRDVGTI